MTSMNLVKAQKYLSKLKSVKRAKGGKRLTSSWTVESNTPSVTKPENYLMNIKSFHANCNESKSPGLQISELVLKRFMDFENHIHILSDIRLLKHAIYSANDKNGISKILVEIERLNEQKALYAAMKERFEMSDVTDVDQFPGIYQKFVEKLRTCPDLSENPYVGVTIALFFDTDTIDETLLTFNRRISKLEDERDALNATVTISYEFCDASKVLLGI